MAKKKQTRKELLKDTDEFLTLSARATIFISEHSRQFSYLGIALAAIAFIYIGFTTYMNYVNKKGQEAYNTAYYAFMKNMGSEVDPKGLKQTEELFEKVTTGYGLSKVSRLAMPGAAYLNFLEKRYDEAISLYQNFLDEASDDTSYQSLARIALASCYEEKREYEKALEILKQVMAGPDEYFKEQAMLLQARIYRLINQLEKSREVLEEFVKKFPASPFLPIAKAHLK